MPEAEKRKEMAFKGQGWGLSKLMQDAKAAPLLKEMGGLILQRDRCHARIQQVVAELDQLERSYGAAAEVEQLVRKEYEPGAIQDQQQAASE